MLYSPHQGGVKMDPIGLKSEYETEPWLEQAHQRMEENSRNPPDPQLDPAQYFALLNGHKNAEEFKADYEKRFLKTGILGTAAGLATFAAAFGVAVGTIYGGTEALASGSVLVRWGTGLGRCIKEIGVKSWETAKSAWSSWMMAISTPKGQKILNNSIECADGMINNISTPSSGPGLKCGGGLKTYEAIDDATKKIFK